MELPPPLIWTAAPFTTKPVGRKKLVAARRSMSCMTMAASKGGKASSKRNAVTNWHQTKKGRRIQVRPLARSWMMVVIKLTAPSKDEVIRRMKPTSQRVCPLKKGSNPGPLSEMSESGVREVHPPLAAPPGTNKLVSIKNAPAGKAQKVAGLIYGKVMSGAPI